MLVAVGAKPQVTVGSPCRHDALPPVFFLFTSTPDRASRLPRVLTTMRQQTLQPSALVLTIARRYSSPRFGNASFALHPDVHNSSVPALKLNVLPDDLGPISKYHGAAMLPAHAIIVVGDDDMWYGPKFIEDYACAVHGAERDAVFSSGIDRDCKALGGCVMGFRGVAMRAGMLHSLASALTIQPPCLLADDVAITYYLSNIRHFKIWRLKLRTKYRFDDEYAWGNSSINAYHRAYKFKINRACMHSLSLPNSM
jgi:hypothetical protein